MLDSKYMMERHAEVQERNETIVNDTKTELISRIESIEVAIDRKVTYDCMTQNFRVLKDILKVKFIEMEDVKEQLRDIMIYNRYYLPITV